MSDNVDDVLAMLQDIAKKMEKPKNIEWIRYREDYQDYQLVLNDDTRCEVREKLVENMGKKYNLDDTIREIEYLMCNSTKLEDWEKEDLGLVDLGGDEGSDGINLDI